MMDVEVRSGPRGAAGPRRGPPPSEFPACATNALQQVDKTIRFQLSVTGSPSQKAAATSNRLKDVQSCLDQELFCLGPDRKSTRLSPIDQLRLLDILCSYFQEVGEKEKDPRQRYSYFDLIFLGREGESLPHEARISILINLCSLAVQYPNCDGLLTDVATWLQKVGLYAKPYAKQIVTKLVEDFCSQESEAEEEGSLHLQVLIYTVPTLTPYIFAISLDDHPLYSLPTIPLIRVIADWLSGNPKAVMRPLMEGAKMGTLVKALEDGLAKLVLLTAAVMPFHQSSDWEASIFTKLHTGTLQAILAIKDTQLETKFTVLDETGMCEALERLMGHRDHSNLGLALDRLAQTFQVTLVSGCFTGSRDAVRVKYQETKLPQHQLFEFIFSN